MAKPITSRSALILVVIAQFLGTSLWFAGNAAGPELESLTGTKDLVPWITSMVQLGFVVCTFLYALLSIPDRYSSSYVFFFSSILASISNGVVLFIPLHVEFILISRLCTGFFLAGIYPVGMKIASDYAKEGLGTALGFLVGALVLGTSFPFILKGFEIQVSWKILLLVPSALALGSGMLVGFGVPNGPYRKVNPKLDLSLISSFTKNNSLKSAAGGYFGHMWELYTFWTFLPALILYLSKGEMANPTVYFWTFIIIATGGFSCALGGLLSQKTGSAKVALISLVVSGSCGVILLIAPNIPFMMSIPLLLVWGIFVSHDSPQFSTLVAKSVLAEHRGTALTLVNCMGFGITIVSIQLVQILSVVVEPKIYIGLLCIGPALGVFFV